MNESYYVNHNNLFLTDNATITSNDLDFIQIYSPILQPVSDVICPVHGLIKNYVCFIEHETYCLMCVKEILAEFLDPLEKGGNMKKFSSKESKVITRYDIAKQNDIEGKENA